MDYLSFSLRYHMDHVFGSVGIVAVTIFFFVLRRILKSILFVFNLVHFVYFKKVKVAVENLKNVRNY